MYAILVLYFLQINFIVTLKLLMVCSVPMFVVCNYAMGRLMDAEKESAEKKQKTE